VTVDPASSPGWLSVETRPGVVVVVGELDLATVPAVTAALRPLVRAGGDVRIDVRGATFIGSDGIHLLEDTAGASLDVTAAEVFGTMCEVVQRDARRGMMDLGSGSASTWSSPSASHLGKRSTRGRRT
jgi:anti-anti-sigma regulatory factor